MFGSLGYSMYMLFFFLFAYTVLPLLEDVVDSSQQQDLGLSSADTGLPVLFILLAIIPPLIEEFVFRGVIFQTIKRWMPFWLATILVSLVFGAMHLELINSSAPPNWIAMIDTTVLSVFMIFAMQKTKSLWTPIFIHFIKNTLAFTLLFLLN